MSEERPPFIFLSKQIFFPPFEAPANNIVDVDLTKPYGERSYASLVLCEAKSIA